jgi:hypothetical protein
LSAEKNIFVGPSRLGSLSENGSEGDSDASMTSPAGALPCNEVSDARFVTPAPNDKRVIRCKCKKSRCLKLYCDCFAILKYCDGSCSCTDCHNDESQAHRVVSTDTGRTEKPLY